MHGFAQIGSGSGPIDGDDCMVAAPHPYLHLLYVSCLFACF